MSKIYMIQNENLECIRYVEADSYITNSTNVLDFDRYDKKIVTICQIKCFGCGNWYNKDHNYCSFCGEHTFNNEKKCNNLSK